MSQDKWWTWRWDRFSGTATGSSKLKLEYDQIVRWRRGWVTFYKKVSEIAIEYYMWLPGNICFGIQFKRKMTDGKSLNMDSAALEDTQYRN